MISDCAHLVLPYHRVIDEQRELRKGHVKIGTTKRGIGPAYGDKAARTGLRMSDLMQPVLFSKKLQAEVRENNSILHALGAKPINYREVNARYLEAGGNCAPLFPILWSICTVHCNGEKKSCLRARKEHFSISITEPIPM